MNSLSLCSGLALAPENLRPIPRVLPPRLSSAVCKISINERSRNWSLQCTHRGIHPINYAYKSSDQELHEVEHRSNTFMDEAQGKSEAMIAAGEAVEKALISAFELVHQNGAQAAKEALTKARNLATKYLNHNLTDHLAFLSEGLNLVGTQALNEAITEAQALISESLNHLQKAINLASKCLHERGRGARAKMEATLLEAESLTLEALKKLIKAGGLVSGLINLGDKDAVEVISMVLRDVSECLKEHGRVLAANRRVAEIVNDFGGFAKNGFKNRNAAAS